MMMSSVPRTVKELEDRKKKPNRESTADHLCIPHNWTGRSATTCSKKTPFIDLKRLPSIEKKIIENL
jgi:hypothetical protein